MSPTVSVVVPCFNLGAYLDEAVQSVLDQTYQDFEILVVDDGSDDPATRHLFDSYQRPRTRVFRTENRGLAAARNLGLEHARGRYVSFLDADDVLEPTFLERTTEALERDPNKAFASCWLTAFGANGFSWAPDDCDFPHLLAEDTVCTAALMYRDIVQAVGGFDTRMPVAGYEDWDLAIALVEQGNQGLIVPEFLFRYRIRPGSMTEICTAPENHARLMEYLVDKHATAYEAHVQGVLRVVEERLQGLEQKAEVPLPRPDLSVDRTSWKTAILRMENHRRALEASLHKTPEVTEEGPLEWGSLRRLEPVSRVWGLDRGQPIDRYYIEGFLERNAESMTGDILEVKDSGYASRFGVSARSLSVVDIADQNDAATLVADLAEPGALPEERYDCFILTQTIHVIYAFDEVVRNAYRTLAPGGVCLATLPCVSRVDYESGVDGDYWRFTSASARRLFEVSFGEGNVDVEAYGNVLACTAFLQGLASTELTAAELGKRDPYFPLLLGVRAVKPGVRPCASARTLEGRLDGATCQSIFGWAWDPGAPEQRLRLEIREGGRRLGTATADGFRTDLKEAGKANGRVGFTFPLNQDIHRDPPAEIRVRLVGSSEVLAGSPRRVECICDDQSRPSEESDAPGVLGFALDSPRPEAQLPFPWLEVAGWALGRDAPVEAVELLCRDEVFRRLPVDRSRPDLVKAFPAVPWAGNAGFATRISLVGIGASVELKLQAVLAGGEVVPIGRIEGSSVADAIPAPVVVMVGGQGHDLDNAALLRQRSPAARVLVPKSAAAIGHPGFEAGVHGWNRTLESSDDGFVWLSDGLEAVSETFLSRAVQLLAEEPEAAFAAAAEPAMQTIERSLASVLSGTALGATAMFRADSARSIGGFDESAPSVLAAQWDLCIRIAASGRCWLSLAEIADQEAATLAERADEVDSRWLYRKHAELYERNLKEVLLDREVVIARFLRNNHLVEREIESDLRPLARARRRERDRLGAKVRALRKGSRSDATTSVDWGDFRRTEPLSPLWGSERGLSVARYYIERFLGRHADDVHGTVLEVHDSIYAHRYGEAQVERCDVVDIDPTNPRATIIADLRNACAIRSAEYECVILTQVLQLIDDPASALRECNRILRPGGVLLATVPCVSKVAPEAGRDGDYWRFTESAFRRLLDSAFTPASVEVNLEGNRAAALAFLVGLAAEEVGQATLDQLDPSAPLILTARAVRPEQGNPR